ncbi:MAG: site-2 protease family protein [Thermomicrobiales bacterium]|nr:site-2 protease family protein [Thermomicrobiales bacterium]
MTWSFNLLRVQGIQIRVHITFALIVLWGAYYWGSVADEGARGALFGVVATLLLFLCVTLHELGHAVQARAYGIEVQDITLYPIGGIARLGKIPENPVQEFRIAIAGPLVNVAIVILLVLFGAIIDEPALRSAGNLIDDMREPSWHLLLAYMTFANLTLAIFNLLPAFPMDGGRILRSLLAMRMPYHRATQIAVTIGQMMAFLFGLYGFATGQFFLILVAIFVWMGAGEEGQQTTTRQLLGTTPVGAAMIQRPWSVSPEFPLQRAVELTLSTAQSDFPVVDRSGQVVGLLTLGQLLEALSTNPQAHIADVMLRDFPTARAEEQIVDVQERLGATKARAIPVVDAQGQLAGLLTLTDILEVLRVLAVQQAAPAGRYATQP